MRITGMLRSLLDRPALVFVILASLFGLISVFSQPPMVVNDEVSHFPRAYEITEGHLITPKLADGRFGGRVPVALFGLDRMNSDNHYAKPNPVKLRKSIASYRHVSINEQQRGELGWSNTAQYSALAYLPQAVTIGIGRILNLSLLTTFYLTRIVVLMCFIGMIILAICLSPVRKWFFVAVGLLPMCIQEAASVSIDALLIAASMVAIAGFLYIHGTKKLSIAFRDWQVPLLPIVALAILYVSLAKPVYFPLFLVFLLLPVSTFKSAAHKWRFMAITLLVPFILMTAWNGLLAVRGSAQAQRIAISAAHIYPPTPREGLLNLAHPSYTAHILFHTYVSQVDTQNVVPNYITLGIFANFTSFFIPGPTWYILSIALSLLLAFCVLDTKVTKFDRRYKLVMLGCMLIASAGITLSMYFYTTTNHQGFINGVQGRYFIPLFIPLLIMMSQQKIIRVTNSYASKALLAGLLTFNLLFMQLIYLQWFWHA